MSARAEQDLRAIAEFVARDRSLDDALALIATIREKIETLERFPNRGPIPDELAAVGETDHRQLFVGPYRIFYLVEDKTVTITLIADGRRDLFSLLRMRITTSTA